MSAPPPRHEPHKTKTVRPLAFPTPDGRKRFLAEAHFNVFNLTPRQVTFDMVSLGTSAMSDAQVAGQYVGDEAYAGARNFESLEEVVRRVFGHTYVCPTHNTLGAVKLIVAALTPRGSVVPSNARGRVDLHAPRGIEIADVRDHREAGFTGNVDLARLGEVLAAGASAITGMQCYADGQHPFSLQNLRQVREVADQRGVRLVLDVSRIVENAWHIQRHEPGLGDRTIADLVKQIAKTAHIILLDGAQDPRCATGGFLATDLPADHERFVNDVVVYEGLHTYGGMAGRTMEVLARGLSEMCNESQVQWVMHQTEAFTQHLSDAGVPVVRGCDGAYLEADRCVAGTGDYAAHAFACALYQTSGVRALVSGLVGRDHLLPIQIPRMALTSDQLEQVARAVINVYRQCAAIPALEVEHRAPWHDELRFRWVFAPLTPFEFDCAPYQVHTFEPIAETTREQREKALRAAGWNTFLLRSADVTIDLLTDSGTSAMSTAQWAAYEGALASPGATDASIALRQVVEDVYGYAHALPTHQGRAAEHILSETLIRPGQLVPGNMYFTTTKVHQELAGGVFVDVIVDEAHDPASAFPWKGNVDLGKLDALVRRHGQEEVAYLSLEFSVNMAGGQPVSMDNLREVYAYCAPRGIPVMFDATRGVENACFIQQRDERYASTSVRDILREMMLYGDGATVSGKKDFLVNIGGLLAFKDNADWARRAAEKLRLYEGGARDGGLAAGDLAAMARGIEEMVDDRYIRSRVEQARYLAGRLRAAGVPVVEPVGGHAVFVDVKRFLPHVDQDEYPAQRLAGEVYVETGVRVMERGNVSKGRDPATGGNYRPSLELVRLTLPRRVYSRDHLDAVADGIIRVFARREGIGGLRFVHEPPTLRFFQGRFEPVG